MESEFDQENQDPPVPIYSYTHSNVRIRNLDANGGGNPKVDGAYTRLLRRALKVDYQQHMTNEALYQGLPRLSEVARDRCLKFVGHCVRAEQQPCSKVVLWRPTHGRARQGRPHKSYIDVHVDDTNLAVEDLPNATRNRKIWRARCSYANSGRIDEGT